VDLAASAGGRRRGTPRRSRASRPLSPTGVRCPATGGRLPENRPGRARSSGCTRIPTARSTSRARTPSVSTSRR